MKNKIPSYFGKSTQKNRRFLSKWKASASDDRFEYNFFSLTKPIDFTCKYVSENHLHQLDLIFFFVVFSFARQNITWLHVFHVTAVVILFILFYFVAFSSALFFLFNYVYVCVCSLSICADRSYRRHSIIRLWCTESSNTKLISIQAHRVDDIRFHLDECSNKMPV